LTKCPVCAATFDGATHIRWTKDGHDVVRCPSCSLLFRRVLPSADELEAIYGLAYFDASAGGGTDGYLDYVADAELHRLAARRRLRTLARLVSGGSLLDVGAAAGFFVAEARAAGWDASGVDVSGAMVEWGRRELGVPLVPGVIGDTAASPGSLEAVTMWDYIEHALDPVGDVAAARELLRPGGVLALSTGDADTLVARLSGKRWHLLTPRHHNFFFTSTTLGDLLRRQGFEIALQDHRGSRYPLRYLAHKLGTAVPSPALERVTRALARSRAGGVPVPLNLFDIVTVVARRT
jgi:SAM-dependent methyltransferase